MPAAWRLAERVLRLEEACTLGAGNGKRDAGRADPDGARAEPWHLRLATLHAELREAGPVGQKPVARLMRQAGFVGCRPRGFRRTTIADPAAQPDDLVKRDFRLDDLDRLWVSDIT